MGGFAVQGFTTAFTFSEQLGNVLFFVIKHYIVHFKHDAILFHMSVAFRFKSEDNREGVNKKSL